MITRNELDKLDKLLQARGLTFHPLKEEMIDHLCCDIEELMMSGRTFDEALELTLAQIPSDHFKIIQYNTMSSIDKRVTVSRGMSYIALGLVYCSTLFKILHLQFADLLLLLTFVFIAASVLMGTFSGLMVGTARKGVYNLVAVVSGIVLMLIGYAFKLLHLPGGDFINIVGVLLTIAALVLQSLHVYNSREQGTLLSFLHETYTPGIERFLMFLLVPVTLFKIATAFASSSAPFMGVMALLIVIFGGVLQFVALTWRAIEANATYRNSGILLALVISASCTVVIFLGQLIPFELRVAIIGIYPFLTAWIVYKIEGFRKLSSLSLILIPVIFGISSLVRLGILPLELNRYIFNIPLMIVLGATLVLSGKNSLMRTFIIISLAGYVLEY